MGSCHVSMLGIMCNRTFPHSLEPVADAVSFIPYESRCLSSWHYSSPEPPVAKTSERERYRLYFNVSAQKSWLVAVYFLVGTFTGVVYLFSI